jgi:hypothetical protein
MALPAARVRLEILKLTAVAAASLSGTDIRYGIATAQAVGGPKLNTGRSRPIPNAGGAFDLAPEAVPWKFEFDLNPGTAISLTISIFRDLGDTGPPAPASLTVPIPDPWKSGDSTFPGTDFSVQVRVTTTYITLTDTAFAARASKASGVSGTLTAPQGFFVQLTDILGLYRPVFPLPAPPAPGAVHVLGYISEDNLGRIYTNRLPNGDWKHDTQYIEIQAKVTAFGGPAIPGGAKIQWTVLDADDPTNDSSSFHREWGPYVDPNDYGSAPTFTPLGAHAGDNVGAYSAGNANESKLFGSGVSGSARWHAAVGGSAPSPSSSSKANSTLTHVDPKTAKTSVRIHCPNVLGTNIIVKAELIGTPTGIPVHNATTGAMTMWCRLDVEVRKMSSAFSLGPALSNIPQYFWPACVQLDFQSEATAAVDEQPMAATDGLLDTKTKQWVNNVFTKKTKPGWFFVGAAGDSIPKPPSTSSPTLLDGTVYVLDKMMLGSQESPTLFVPGVLTDPQYVEFTWFVAGKKQVAGFGVDIFVHSGTSTLIVLSGNDITPLFTGSDSDGKIEHAYKSKRWYFPQHERHAKHGPLVAGSGGFRVPPAGSGGARVEISGPGAVVTSGYSPDPPLDGYFGGRTVIFTKFYEVDRVFEPDKPNVLSFPTAGAFAAGRDVYLRTTLVNSHGETDMSDPFVVKGTAGSERIMVLSPFLTPWHSSLGAGNVPTAYNVYEADVPAGSPAPPSSAFKRAASAALGTPAPVDDTATGGGPPAVNTAAITPSVPSPNIYTHVVSTIVHEFTHAFGMPHKCGYWDWRTPRNQSCCMNYFDTWMIGFPPAFKLLENTVGKKGNHMCGRHLMEVRRVHLERNKALKALGW